MTIKLGFVAASSFQSLGSKKLWTSADSRLHVRGGQWVIPLAVPPIFFLPFHHTMVGRKFVPPIIFRPTLLADTFFPIDSSSEHLRDSATWPMPRALFKDVEAPEAPVDRNFIPSHVLPLPSDIKFSLE